MAHVLNISAALVHLWLKMGILVYDQRVSTSKRWVRVTELDMRRLNGSTDCADLPTIAEVMMAKNFTWDKVWALVRAGQFAVYRSQHGGNWEWRLTSVGQPEQDFSASSVVAYRKGTLHYE